MRSFISGKERGKPRSKFVGRRANQLSSGFNRLLVLQLVRAARIDAASAGVSEQSRRGVVRAAVDRQQGRFADARFAGQGALARQQQQVE